MPEYVIHCLLCGSQLHSLFDITNFRGHKVVNRICDGCGFVFQSPRMTDEELGTFYTRDYRQVYHGDGDINQRDLVIQNGRANALLEFVSGSIPGVMRHLDIGCSAGILLERFSSHYGCTPVGVEPGESYRKYAQSKGLVVYRDLSEILKNGEGRVDLISLAHVLEHIPDPTAYLKQLREDYLTSDGYLLLEVPNLYIHDSFEIAHMSSFSKHTLAQTLKKSGFEVVAARKHGKPRSNLLPLYLSVLARTMDKEVVRFVIPEKKVHLKRMLGMCYRRLVQYFVPKMAWVPIKIQDETNEKSI